MSHEMRQEMIEVKTRLSGVETHLCGIDAHLSGIDTRLDGIDTRLDRVETRLDRVETRLDGVETRLGTVEKTVHHIAVVVTGHTETFVRMEKQLAKLDELDGVKKCLEVFTAEIIASRHERTLAGKTFSDQQETLTDHELRLTRIELRNKLS